MLLDSDTFQRWSHTSYGLSGMGSGEGGEHKRLQYFFFLTSWKDQAVILIKTRMGSEWHGLELEK